MLRGERVVLRAVERADLEALWRWQNDLELWLLTSERAPRPTSFAEFQAAYDRDRESPGAEVTFAVEADGRLVGRCVLFAFDDLARSAKIGVTLGERADRGLGYGRDVVRVLLAYGFRTRNLHRISLDTLATNERARRAYRAVGFAEEGRLREAAWVDGRYVDVVLMGVLRNEWERGEAPAHAT